MNKYYGLLSHSPSCMLIFWFRLIYKHGININSSKNKWAPAAFWWTLDNFQFKKCYKYLTIASKLFFTLVLWLVTLVTIFSTIQLNLLTFISKIFRTFHLFRCPLFQSINDKLMTIQNTSQWNCCQFPINHHIFHLLSL